jgi:anaerobic sulfite reductase subunit B
MASKNDYIPFRSKILGVTKHTGIEYTFRMEYADAGSVRPGQFFEVSIPKFGEAPISVSGIGDGSVDLTIRRVGKVTNEIFEQYVGDSLMLRGPYGNGFDLEKYKGRELVVIAGGTGLSPVRGVVDHFARHPEEVASLTLIAGFKTPADILFLEELGRWRQTANVILTVDCDDEGVGSCHIGLVTEHIPNIPFKNVAEAQAVIVGPPAMMRFSTRGLLAVGMREKNLWISHERKMCCGLGKCGHCKINGVYVCLDGPVFNYAEAAGLLD